MHRSHVPYGLYNLLAHTPSMTSTAAAATSVPTFKYQFPVTPTGEPLSLYPSMYGGPYHHSKISVPPGVTVDGSRSLLDDITAIDVVPAATAATVVSEGKQSKSKKTSAKSSSDTKAPKHAKRARYTSTVKGSDVLNAQKLTVAAAKDSRTVSEDISATTEVSAENNGSNDQSREDPNTHSPLQLLEHAAQMRSPRAV